MTGQHVTVSNEDVDHVSERTRIPKGHHEASYIRCAEADSAQWGRLVVLLGARRGPAHQTAVHWMADTSNTPSGLVALLLLAVRIHSVRQASLRIKSYTDSMLIYTERTWYVWSVVNWTIAYIPTWRRAHVLGRQLRCNDGHSIHIHTKYIFIQVCTTIHDTWKGK